MERGNGTGKNARKPEGPTGRREVRYQERLKSRHPAVCRALLYDLMTDSGMCVMTRYGDSKGQVLWMI
jgi:hypothetical protein